MSHGIERSDKVAIVRSKGWHGLGHQLDEHVTPDEARERFINWEPVEHPLYTVNEAGEQIAVASHKVLLRSDNDEQLGVVGQGYTPFKNVEMTEFIKDVVGADDVAAISSVGSLNGGKRIFFSLEQGRHDVAGVDPVERYSLFANGHDGGLAIRVLPTNISVVCANTFAFSGAADVNGKGISLRHTKNVADAVKLAREALTKTAKEHEAMAVIQDALAATQVDQEWLRGFFLKAYACSSSLPTPIKAGMTDEAAEKARKEQERCTKVVGQWLANWEDHDGGDRPAAVQGSAWEAFNSVTRWVDHGRTVRGEGEDRTKRTNSNLFGAAASLKRDVWDVAVELATT